VSPPLAISPSSDAKSTTCWQLQLLTNGLLPQWGSN
jgi:hypothetical protein